MPQKTFQMLAIYIPMHCLVGRKPQLPHQLPPPDYLYFLPYYLKPPHHHALLLIPYPQQLPSQQTHQLAYPMRLHFHQQHLPLHRQLLQILQRQALLHLELWYVHRVLQQDNPKPVLPHHELVFQYLLLQPSRYQPRLSLRLRLQYHHEKARLRLALMLLSGHRLLQRYYPLQLHSRRSLVHSVPLLTNWHPLLSPPSLMLLTPHRLPQLGYPMLQQIYFVLLNLRRQLPRSQSESECLVALAILEHSDQSLPNLQHLLSLVYQQQCCFDFLFLLQYPQQRMSHRLPQFSPRQLRRWCLLHRHYYSYYLLLVPQI